MELESEQRKYDGVKAAHVWSGKRISIGILVCAAMFLAAVSPEPRNPNQTFTLVLDAGHGGKDPGNLGTGRFKEAEKDVTLAVTLAVGKYIGENFPDVEIVYTRKGDTFPTLKQRTEIANENQADLFISIHCNANDNKAAYGSETYVMGLHKSEESLQTAMRENASIFLEENHKDDYGTFDPKNPDTYIALSLRENIYLDQSLRLAKDVQEQFRSRVGRKDRGVKQAGFQVISYTNMPSILIELGFLTNQTEEEFLVSEEGKSYMASAVYRAFKLYKEKTEIAKPTEPVSEEIKVNQPVELKLGKTQSEEIPYHTVNEGIKYQVQILSSVKPVDKKSAELKELDRVDEYFSNGIYKYFAGSTSSYNEAKATQQVLRTKGFKDAFVVAFEGGKRIDLSTAIVKTGTK